MTITENTSDQELVKLFEDENNREAVFRIIMKRYGARLYSHARTFFTTHNEADDIVQNTFIKAWRALPKFRSQSSLYTWLYKISTNETLTLIRNRKSKQNISLDNNEQYQHIPIAESNSYQTGDEIAQRLQKAIEQLPEKQRVVFNMKYFEEMKYEEMSKILNTSIGALKASYHFAVKKIENYLEND